MATLPTSVKNLLRKVIRSKWFPDRKTLAAGLAGVAAFYLVLLFNMPPDVAAAFVSALASIASYFVKPSTTDLAKTADTIITDTGGKVTDLLWKFDKPKSERRIHITKKENADVVDSGKLAAPVSTNGGCGCGSCGCRGPQS